MEDFLQAILFRTFGKDPGIQSYQSISGGCINNGHSVKCKSDSGKTIAYFIKWNEDQIEDLFEKESKGLSILETHSGFKTPQVIGYGAYGTKNYLILEHIESGKPTAQFWNDFGHQLAEMHKNIDRYYGLKHSNYIGKLHQKNDQKDNWIDFFIENRLESQLGLAVYNNKISIEFAKKFRFLYSQLPGILVNEPPSLLHGDLWSGNFMIDSTGNPCLIDPAVYYGNREIEIAFTQLFGGFHNRFYQSYQEAFPINPGFSERAEIYNLHPLLVHVNLFGESYLSGVEQVIRKYC